MGPLPKTVPFDADGVSTWNLLLSAEEAASREPQAFKYKDPLIVIRILGFFLLDFWNHQKSRLFGLRPYKSLLLKIKSCYAAPRVTAGDHILAAQHTTLFQLGLKYCNYLVRVYSEPLPATESSPTSRSSFDQARRETIQRMLKADKTKSDVKSVALLRDGYKCLISGVYDCDSCSHHQEIFAKALDEKKSLIGTECAHIFSESAQNKDRPPEYAGTTLTILNLFSFDTDVEKLLGGQVNRLSNVLTMSHDLHEGFRKFQFWLEEVAETPNTYKVMALESANFLHLLAAPPAQSVTFNVDSASAAACEANDAPLPDLPSPTLIAIRSACARVAHISGAIEQFDHILRDGEDTTVMSSDGSTADVELLTSLINARVITVGG